MNLRCLCEAAILVALAQVLSYIKLMELPNGGSLTPAMFPLLLFAVRWGVKPGLLAGFAFGLLQLIFDGAYVLLCIGGKCLRTKKSHVRKARTYDNSAIQSHSYAGITRIRFEGPDGIASHLSRRAPAPLGLSLSIAEAGGFVK